MSTKTQLIEALEKSRELIKIGWIKGSWARNKEGKNVDPWSEDACEWCVEGAILGATHFQDTEDKQLASACIQLLQAANKEFSSLSTLNKIKKGQGNTTQITSHSVVPPLNDNPFTTREQIIRMFDNAILLTKSAKFKKSK